MATLPLFTEAEQEARQGNEYRDDAEHQEIQHVSLPLEAGLQGRAGAISTI
jgi:hypothetical protein